MKDGIRFSLICRTSRDVLMGPTSLRHYAYRSMLTAVLGGYTSLIDSVSEHHCAAIVFQFFVAFLRWHDVLT